MKLLQNRMDAHEIDDPTVPCNSDLSLRRENVRLQSDLESAKSTIKQLKTKVNELQSEKSSLTTVIRLLQEDNLQHTNYSDRNNNANDQQKNAWTAAKTPKKRRKRSTYVTKERLPTSSTNAVTEETASTNAVTEENLALADTMPEELNVNGHSNGQGETQESSSNMQEEQSRTHNSETTKPTKVIIAGDSMIKHLNGYRMSAKNTRVQVSTFPGCTILDMADHVKPIQRKRPDKLILHVGTNSLKSRETSTKHAEEIISLAESVKNTLPETEVIISGLITRIDNGDLANKVNQVNKVLKEMCLERHWKFIGHHNITSNHLNRSGIHLNKVGTAMLSRNFNKYIHNKKD
jgi:hypothetical protein